MKFHTFYIVWIVLFLLTALTAKPATVKSQFNDTTYSQLYPEKHHAKLEQIIAQFLMKNHYKRFFLDDSLSSFLYNEYLRNMDFNRIYFLKSDINEFDNDRYQFDNDILNGNLDAAYLIFNRFRARFIERIDYALKAIQTPFDFTINETYTPKRDSLPWAASVGELDTIWYKRLKNEALSLKLANKNNQGIQETLEKRYKNLKKRMIQYETEEVFQLFINSFTESIDPHTTYFSPKNSEDFKINMSLSLEGIGASLQSDNDYTKIIEIVPGGPADKSGLLHSNDRIIGVAQGIGGEMVDVIGWRLDDVVRLIRGPKTTIVRLQVLRAKDGENSLPVTIQLVRDKIKLEDRAAAADTLYLDYEGGKHCFGVIDIPTFYADFDSKRNGDENYKSTTNDVRRILKEFENLNIEGIIIDLRRNGGGFLSEAVELSGLFISDGPIVQVRYANGAIRSEFDTDPEQVYSGRLAVLVDEGSASASEIFAAAIQDYHRGIVIGNQTYGKGTVQNVTELNRYLGSNDNYGQLKFTNAKFYRINGSSTQHLGVIPDIEFPTRYNHDEIGESSNKSALIWDQIEPAQYDNYSPNLTQLIPSLRFRHNERIQTNQEFNDFLKDITEYQEKKKQTSISLLESSRRAELKKDETYGDDDSESYDESEEDSIAQNDSTDQNQPKKLYKSDFMIKECGFILADYKKISK